MNWKPGDYAVLQIFDNPDLDGEIVMLCSKIEGDEYGRFYYAPKKFVQDAWWVAVKRPGEVDQRIMSQHVLTPVSHPNEKSSWLEPRSPFRPLEYVKYP